jgi:hypothetical protein
MAQGWLDGRHGLPLVSPVGRVGPAADSGRETAVQADAVIAPGRPAPWLWTPRMEVLSRQARELIEQEKERLDESQVVLKRESAHLLKLRDAVAGQVAAAEQRLAQARDPLSAADRDQRRFAEQDTRRRPAELVRARRQTGWERRMDAAEQDYQSLILQLAEATRESGLRAELIRDRAEVGRAAARRHHELALRRIATYLQQLIRRHEHGAELNRLLIHYCVGPDLPEWTIDPAGEPPDAGPPAGAGTAQTQFPAGRGSEHP